MKKLMNFAACLAAAAALITYNPTAIHCFVADETAVSAEASEDKKIYNDENVSRTAVVLTVITVFTVTSAVTAIVTFKLRRKKTINENSNKLDNIS